MRNYNTRQAQDLGTGGTRKWLTEWFDAEEDLAIQRLPIACPRVAALSKSDRQKLGEFRSGNQSELHAYLKLAAYKWLLKGGKFPHSVRSEVICYSPDPRRCEGRRCFDWDGTELDIHSPQIIPPDSAFPLSYGDTIRADLLCEDISIEIGGTYPFNLLMPLIEGLTKRSLWLPYPDSANPRGVDCRKVDDHIYGYVIQIRWH
ncbi:MAG: hypothetical protein ABIT10_10230 [Alteraurantiacibacter sp.]